MVVWDTVKQQVAPFGLNKHIAAKDENNFDEENKNEETANLQICYKIFDILYIKAHGEDSEEINLMGARLTDRKIVLNKVVREIPNIVEIVPYKLCQTVDEVFEEFNQSIFKNEEGIMIKRAESPYKPNERASNNWIKLKGEYIDSIGDTLDLIIIGGYFGERKRIGVSVLLIFSLQNRAKTGQITLMFFFAE
jgi:DNA ligase-4